MMTKKETFEILTANVLSVSAHKDKPHTLEIATKTLLGEKYDSLTIDPRCTFYKDDKQPKGIEIVKPDDMIEATYIVNKGIKVALNIIVKPKSAL